MKHLARLSYAITILGLMCAAAALMFDLGPFWILVGAMLTIAGFVKIAVVHIWLKFAHLE